MMHDQPNNSEYCQGIYEAAKKLTDYYHSDNVEKEGYPKFIEKVHYMIVNLKRALEGKP